MTRDEGPTLDLPSGDDEQNPKKPSDAADAADVGETMPLEVSGEPSASTVRLDRGGEPESLGGAQIGPYRVLSVLGEGGFGVVYLAEQTQPVRRRVAMKVIKPGMDSRAVVARFEAERQALAVMDHPCIARVFDAGQTPRGRPYFVMEFVRGVPLTDFVSKHKLGLEARLKLFRRVCEAVQHAHSKGIIHRDLKPSNILVEYEDNQATPKIIDFGVAKALDQRLTEKTIFTEQGQILGTPEYMSPEQAEMSGLDIDTRTDIYALGVVLYELLTGQLPFDPRSLRSAGYAEIQRIIREVEPQKPSTKLSTAGAAARVRERGDQAATRPLRDAAMDSRDLTRRLRRDLDWVVMKCLEKNRERRYGTANELAAEVDRYLKFEPVQAGPPSVGYKLAKFVRRRRAFVVSAALVALAIAVGVAGLAIGLTREAAARERAEIAAAEARQLAGFTTGILTGLDPEVAQGFDTRLLRRIFDDAEARVEDEVGGSAEVEATIRAALGVAYNAIAAPTAAERQLREAVTLREAELGPDAEATLEAKTALAEALWDSGQFAEAEAMYKALIERRTAEFGADGRETLALRQRLWSVVADDGRLDEADAGLGPVLAAQEAELGVDDPDTLRTVLFVSKLRGAQGEAAEAEALARRGLEGRRKSLGDDDPMTLIAEQQLAVQLYGSGKFDDAVELLTGSLERQRRVLGAEHTTTLATMQTLGASLRRSGDVQGALDVLGPAVAAHRKKYGLGHIETFKVLIAAGNAAEASGEWERALALFSDAVASAEEAEGGPAFYGPYAASLRGKALLRLERYGEAEAALLEAHAALVETAGAEAAVTRAAAGSLAEVYEATGRDEEGRRWREVAGGS